MSRGPIHVATGVHVPKVPFWARVLVAPERLQQVKQSILNMGRVDLRPGEVLEIDTLQGDDLQSALTVRHGDAERRSGASLVAWSETGDVTVYSDDADRVAALTDPVTVALVDRAPFELISKAGVIHCETIDSIHVGSVHVHFDRVPVAKAEHDPEDNRAAEEEPDEWLLSQMRIKDLQYAINAERLRIHRLGVRPRWSA